MGLRIQSIKTGEKTFNFWKELMFVVVKTTFVFEKEVKEEEVLQKKKWKAQQNQKLRLFFLPHSFIYLKPIQPTDLKGNGKKSLYTNAI